MAFIDPDAVSSPAPTSGGFKDPDAQESKGFFSEAKKVLSDMSFEDWKKNSMIAPIIEYTARSALGGIMPGLEPITPAEQKQVQRSASETINALKEGVANPVETGKAIFNKAQENPGAFTADLIKGLVYDPEMLFTGGVGRIAPLAADAGKVAQAARVAANTANTATQFGVLAAGAEGARAKLEGRDVNPEDLMKAATESVYTAVAFEAMHNAISGAKRGFTAPPEVKPIEPVTTSVERKAPSETLFKTPEEKDIVMSKADAIRTEIEKIQEKYAGTDKPLNKTDAKRLQQLDKSMANDPRLVEAMKERIDQKRAFTEAEPTIVTEAKQVPTEPPLVPEAYKADRYAAEWADVAGLYAKRNRKELLSSDEIRRIKDFERAEAGQVRPGSVPEMEPATKVERSYYEIYPGQSREAVLAHANEAKLETLDNTAGPKEQSIVGKSLAELENLKREGSYEQQASEAIRRRINDIQANERFIHNDAVKLIKDVPETVARERIAEAIDRGAINTLKGKELEAAKFLKTKFKEIGEKAKALGIVKELRENYITHIVDWEKAGIKNISDAVNSFIESGASRGESTSGKSRFGKERKYETFEDLNKALQDTGLELRTKDAAEIYQAYARSMNKAIENRKMINELKDMKDVDGNSLLRRITEKEPIPRGWTTVQSPQLQGYAVHPDIAQAIKFAFESSEPSMVAKAANALSQVTKRLQVMASFFHAKSLLEAKIFTGFGDTLKDVFTGFKGTRDALEMYKKGGLGDEVDFLIKNGLKVEMPEDVSRGILSDIGRGADVIMEKMGPKTGGMGEKLGAGVEKYTLGVADKLTWDFMHTGFKLQVALRELERAKLNHPNASPVELAREVNSFVNNTFGGLNWFDVAQRSTTKIGKELAMWAFNNQNRRALQLVLFAPDWTVSTLRALSTAFGKGSGLKGLIKPRYEADFARQYQLRAALIYGTAINALNNATAGRDIWDNKDPTRLEFRDGTSMQLAKHSMEPVHWIKDPAKTLTNKLGFIPQITAPLIFGKEYLSPGAPDLLDQSLTGRLKAAGSKALPFQVQSVMSAPSGEGVKRAIAGTLGVPIYGGTPEQKAEKRIERKRAEMDRRIEYIKQEQERAAKTRPE